VNVEAIGEVLSTLSLLSIQSN